MHIDEVEEMPLGTLYFFLQAVHSLVLHIQHVFALNNRIEARKERCLQMKMREPTKCDHVLRALWRAQRFALDVLNMTFCTVQPKL